MRDRNCKIKNPNRDEMKVGGVLGSSGDPVIPCCEFEHLWWGARGSSRKRGGWWL